MKTSVLAALAAFAASAAPLSAETVAVTADRLLDVETGRYVADPVVVIVDGKVASVTSGGAVPEGAERIDLAGHTLLPGLIDMHVHLSGRPEYGGYSGLQFTDRFWTAIAVSNARTMLEIGFTTIRNVGDSDYNVAGVDQAIEEGWIIGPRIVNANYALGATGGHCDETFLPPLSRPPCKNRTSLADHP